MLRSRCKLLRIAMLTGIIAGCADQATGRTGLARDSAGVTILEHGPIDAEALPQWSLGAASVVSIGTVAGDPQYQFYQVQDATRLRDGSIAVIDRSRTVRLFDSAGTLLWSAGGEGEGPGEFRYPSMLRAIPGDSLVIWDGALKRLSVFAPDGRFVRDANASQLNGQTMPSGVSVSYILVAAVQLERTTIDGHAAIVHPSDFYLVSLDGTIARELGRRIYATGFQEVDENGAFSSAIFAAPAVFAPSAEGMWFGSTQENELREVVDRDRTRRIIRWQGPDRTVTEPDVRAVLAKWSEGADPEVQSYLVEYGKTHPRSDEFPAYERLLVDQTGRLWVQDFVKDHLDTGVRRWLILSADGTQFLGRFTHPASIDQKDIGDDWILAVHKDELEVESIVVYTIARDDGQ